MKSFFLKHNKKFSFVILLLFIVIVLLVPSKIAFAIDVEEAILKIVGFVISPIILLMGNIATLLLNLLVWVAQYNNFIGSSAVSFGWVLVRDLCNMFFVLILLVIAFATILKVDSYNLKTWLPKLVIMAILINFSKLICGVFIDFTQVIMLTFVNAFKDIAGANMSDMLGITSILNFDPKSTADATLASVIAGLLLALVMVIISVVVILIMLFMLVIRMIMIWIYVVLSPLAYLLASFPQGQSYSQRWWSEFSKNLIIGPVLAFFIWLSFASLGGVAGQAEISAMKKETNFSGEAVADITITEAGSPEHMLKFIVSIGMLLGGLMIAQEMGGAAGKAAGKGLAKVQAMGTGAVKLGKRATGIERVGNALKARKAAKETKRSELAQRDAGTIAKVSGKVKKAVVSPINKTGKGIGNLVKRMGGVSQSKIDETRKGIESDESKKVELEDLKVKIEDIRAMSDDIGDRKSAELDAAYELDTEDMKKRIVEIQEKYEPEENLQKQKEADLVSQYQDITGDASVSSFANIDSSKIEDDISSLGKKIEKGGEDLAERMRKVKILDKTASIVGNILTMGGKNKVMHAGEKDLSLASNHNSGQISKHKENMKEEATETLRKKANDYSKPFNSHERIAASMTLMERGEFSFDEAKIKSDEIKKSYGKDNKVMNQLDSSVAGNYQNLSKNFVDLHKTAEPPKDKNGVVKIESSEEKRSREKKHEKAKEQITRGVVSGTIKLENINDQKSLDLIVPKMADIMTGGGFNSVHDKQTVSQKNKIEIALKNAPKGREGLNARIKLAGIKNSLNVLEGAPEKSDYLAKAGKDQLEKLTSSIKGLESLKKFFQESGKLERFRAIAREGKDNDFRREINSITKNMQFNESPVHTAMLKQIMGNLRS